MLLGETMSVALEALRANKLRSLLTMLGIVIGVAAVIAMVALGRGAQQSVNQRITSLGTTLLTVMPGQARGPGMVASASDRAPLTLDDATAIEDRATHVLAVQPEMSRQLQVQYQSKNTNTTIVGTTANYLEVRKFSMASGRMFTTGEDAARRRVAVLGAQVVSDLGVSPPRRSWARRSGSPASGSRSSACSRPRGRAGDSATPTTRCSSRSRPRATASSAPTDSGRSTF